jgi:hypothetical protein
MAPQQLAMMLIGLAKMQVSIFFVFSEFFCRMCGLWVVFCTPACASQQPAMMLMLIGLAKRQVGAVFSRGTHIYMCRGVFGLIMQLAMMLIGLVGMDAFECVCVCCVCVCVLRVIFCVRHAAAAYDAGIAMHLLSAHASQHIHLPSSKPWACSAFGCAGCHMPWTFVDMPVVPTAAAAAAALGAPQPQLDGCRHGCAAGQV